MTEYRYDEANRLTSAGETSYQYDKAGNLIARLFGDEETTYSYNAAGKMTGATFSDGTEVTYGYDAFGRKVRRSETAWVAQGNPHGTPPGLTDAKGWGNNSDCDQGKPEETRGNDKDPHANRDEKKAAHKKLKLVEETTSYFYDGLTLTLLKEYKGLSASKAEYYYANGQVLARKMFGYKGSILPDREPGLANGGTYYYLSDALGSVTDLVDAKGTVARQYRYDAFGGLFTGVVGLYNTTGLTGKSYDVKLGLMDYSARWYDPATGRFTQADTYLGRLENPLTQHRFTYAHNNPVNLTDPTGHAVPDPDQYWVNYGVWAHVGSRSSGSTTPPGYSEPEPGITREQIEQEARARADRIISETVGTAPVPDATASGTSLASGSYPPATGTLTAPVESSAPGGPFPCAPPLSPPGQTAPAWRHTPTWLGKE